MGPTCTCNAPPTRGRYTPTGSFLYDRLIAATGTEGSVSFLVFLSDGLGYIAVAGVLLAKTFLLDGDGGDGGDSGQDSADGDGSGAGLGNGTLQEGEGGAGDQAFLDAFVMFTYVLVVATLVRGAGDLSEGFCAGARALSRALSLTLSHTLSRSCSSLSSGLTPGPVARQVLITPAALWLQRRGIPPPARHGVARGVRRSGHLHG